MPTVDARVKPCEVVLIESVAANGIRPAARSSKWSRSKIDTNMMGRKRETVDGERVHTKGKSEGLIGLANKLLELASSSSAQPGPAQANLDAGARDQDDGPRVMDKVNINMMLQGLVMGPGCGLHPPAE